MTDNHNENINYPRSPQDTERRQQLVFLAVEEGLAEATVRDPDRLAQALRWLAKETILTSLATHEFYGRVSALEFGRELDRGEL